MSAIWQASQWESERERAKKGWFTSYLERFQSAITSSQLKLNLHKRNSLCGFENAGNPFWYLRFYFTEQRRKNEEKILNTIQSLDQIKSGWHLTEIEFQCMIQSKIDPYLLLSERRERKILYDSYEKVGFFLFIIILFDSQMKNIVY